MLVVDLMHEFELGVWKALLTHLIRMLYAIGTHAVNAFNQKYILCLSTLQYKPDLVFSSIASDRFQHLVALQSVVS